MAILVDKNTRLLVQGITGREGLFHTQQMIAYGTNIVGGVTPGKGGEWVEGIPVFETIKEARHATGATATISFVPARFAVDALYEAIDAEIELIVSRPSPGPWKMYSTMNAPPISVPTLRPPTVTSVNVEGRSAWRRRIHHVGRPLERAIVMKSCCRVAIMSVRSTRM